MEIYMKDLKTLLKYLESSIDRDKRVLEGMKMKNKDDRTIFYIEKRINETEPIIADINEQLQKVKIDIK